MFKATILLVDDVKIFLEVQKEFLRHSPVRVLTARNGEEALECARFEQPDLIVMDVEMPEMDGITCCSVIKADPLIHSTPVILLSCNCTHEVTESARRAGCDKFLEKPVYGRDFLNVAHSFLPVIERRRPRVSCRVPVTIETSDQFLEGTSEDIGMNGLYVATGGEIHLGSEILASFRLPTNAYSMTMARGRVVWTNFPRDRRKPTLPAGFGVEFQEITGEGVRHLRIYELNEFISNSAALSV